MAGTDAVSTSPTVIVFQDVPDDERQAFPDGWRGFIGRGCRPPSSVVAPQEEFFRSRLDKDPESNRQLILRYLACLRLGVFLPEHDGKFVDVSHAELDAGPRICARIQDAHEGDRGRRVFVLHLGVRATGQGRTW